jgi:protein-ribulosamine 3-kinase
MHFLQAALARSLGRTTVRADVSPLSGGDTHAASKLSTSEGEFFAKWMRDGPDDIFIREAEGLEALRAASREIVIPRVVAAARSSAEIPAHLILEFLPPATHAARLDDEALGRGLATIHRATRTTFGFEGPSYCGLTRQNNRECATWQEFYRDLRLRPLVDALWRAHDISAGDREVFERLLGRLEEWLPRDSVPSLIHGDLWSGNVLPTARGPALVDPGCAYSDREMEFGITTLFGGMSPRAFAAYEEAWPMRADWRDRNPLYQLYHLLNHATLFGGSYGTDALRIAQRYVG